jgi:ribose transport system substrate-binding protein
MLVVIVFSVILNGCGGGDQPAADGAAAESGTTAEKPLEIAFMNVSSANTWTLKSREAMERVAKERGANLTEFDAEFNLEKQAQQLQDVITSGKYDGILVNPVGAGVIPDVEAALEAGIKVGVQGQILGDKLDTVNPQVKGLSVSVTMAPLLNGERWGKLTLRACEGKDPCRVVYYYGIKGGPSDVAYKKGFDSIIAQNPAIKVVAEAEGKFLGPEVGLSTMQDILQSTPDFEVIVGPDQPLQGAQQALEEAGKLEGVAIIGQGGSTAAIDMIKAGKWFGGVVTAPQTEGELAMNAILDALEKGVDSGGIDPLENVPGDGMITKDNVDQFEPQWVG